MRGGRGSSAGGRGASTRAISRPLGVEEAVVSTWHIRFAEEGLAGLVDRQRSGKPKTYTAETGRRILALLDQPPPAGYARCQRPAYQRIMFPGTRAKR